MKRFYSKSTGSTYLQGIHATMPPDAVEISEDIFISVIANPDPKKTRSHNDAGRPVLVDPPPLSSDELAANVRFERDSRLAATSWLIERHRDELETGDTTLTPAQYESVLRYRQELRDIPQQPGFPDSVNWPSIPKINGAENGSN